MMKDILHMIKMETLKRRVDLNYKLGNSKRGDYLASELIAETLIHDYKYMFKSLGI